ncbi:hypothetical protein ACKE45_003496 [Klebsiella pneumoniae]|nr:hypothetical protein [Klebsiella pneumoniae]EKU6211065.1 hypothetical protein [Klebsiella pneumoniae]EKW0446800.1 hypothetical protein [Klebsiella pneumoniae]ELI8942119.1 hypothetical protein [Klebsiella pneumoniae]ELQ4739968.1 hypothetical protein [Klebsiella pneumoniae]
MTITLQAVNELIRSLESAGELSIREQKFLKLAKAYQQLAAENVALKAGVLEAFEEMESHHDTNGLYSYDADGEQMDALIRLCDAQGTISDLLSMLETPATDRIVAGIKADGVEEFAAYQRAITEEWACKEGHSSLLKVAESAEIFAKQLREGADK